MWLCKIIWIGYCLTCLNVRCEDLQQYSKALESNYATIKRLQILLDDPKQPNLLISPLGAAVLVSELALGAKGDIQNHLHDFLSLTQEKEEMGAAINQSESAVSHETLHVQLGSMLEALKSDSVAKSTFVLEEVSSLFLDAEEELNKNFENRLRSFYSADVHKVNFTTDSTGTQELINNWSSKHTKGLIPIILNEPPNPSTVAIFANAIYFNGNWEYPFDEMFNIKRSFSVRSDKEVDVTYMFNSFENILHVETSNYKMICLPYKSGSVGMYILLPSLSGPYVYNIKEFVKSFDIGKILDTVPKSDTLTNVRVALPKMSLSNEINFLNILRRFKTVQYQETTNNNSISEDVSDIELLLESATLSGSLKISTIVQKIKISINEKGTEAAAVSLATADRILGKSFIASRPFVFFIRHEFTGAILFWGAISDPTK